MIFGKFRSNYEANMYALSFEYLDLSMMANYKHSSFTQVSYSRNPLMLFQPMLFITPLTEQIYVFGGESIQAKNRSRLRRLVFNEEEIQKSLNGVVSVQR